MEPERHHAEHIAAIVNALIVLLAPLSFLAIGSFVFDQDEQYSVTVHASDPAPLADWIDGLLILGEMGVAFLPFAAIAAWRTWVHAKLWPQDRGWQGVAEADAFGLTVALVYLSPGTRPRPVRSTWRLR